MNILNSLRQLVFGMSKPAGEEELRFETRYESESEYEEEEEKVSEEETIRRKRYNSLLGDHMFGCSEGPSSELVDAIIAAEGKDGDCDFCLMFGVDECCLHRTSGTRGVGSTFKSLVDSADRKSDWSIQYEGLSFRAGISKRSNRCVLFIEGDIDFCLKNNYL